MLAPDKNSYVAGKNNAFEKNNENVRVTEESANNHIHDVTDMSHIISLKMEKYFSTY